MFCNADNFIPLSGMEKVAFPVCNTMRAGLFTALETHPVAY